MRIFNSYELIQDCKEILLSKDVERQVGVPTPTSPGRPNAINPLSICLWNEKRKTNDLQPCRHCKKQIKKPLILCDECENEWLFQDERESKHREE